MLKTLQDVCNLHILNYYYILEALLFCRIMAVLKLLNLVNFLQKVLTICFLLFFVAKQAMLRKMRVLIVSGFDCNYSAARLELFFKNKTKSGGGPIQYVQMNKMNSKLAVQFKEEKSKNHLYTVFFHCTQTKKLMLLFYFIHLINLSFSFINNGWLKFTEYI